jgi:hypothetical protein
MKDKTPKIIAVDFDGTLCTNAYPEIGEPIPYSLLYVTRAKAAGHIITLHTCRQGKSLDDAIAWCKARGITFDYINENVPANIKRFGGDTRKIYADVYVYADNTTNPTQQNALRLISAITYSTKYGRRHRAANGKTLTLSAVIPTVSTAIISSANTTPNSYT